MILKMMKKLLILLGFSLLFLLLSWAANSQQPVAALDRCRTQAPYGFPQQHGEHLTPICRTAYALMHDNQAKIASWVVYTLTSENSIGCLPRTNRFAPDDRLPVGRRAELVDYAGSGYDTGHIANSADMSWDPIVAKESFVLSNAAPQLPALNRGAWRQLETTVRTWAYMIGAQGSVTIYAGSIYDGQTLNRVGPNRVVVPSHFYKIVINNVTRQSLAFVFPHEDVSDFRISQTTVAQVEALTKIRFDIPDDRNAQHQIWATDHRRFLSASRRKCSRITG